MLLCIVALAALYLLDVEGVVRTFNGAFVDFDEAQKTPLILLGALFIAASILFFALIRYTDGQVEDLVNQQAKVIVKLQSFNQDTSTQREIIAEQKKTIDEEKKSIDDERLKNQQAAESVAETHKAYALSQNALAQYAKLITCIDKLRTLNEKRIGADFPFNASLQEIMALTNSSFGTICDVREGKVGHEALRFLSVCSKSSEGAPGGTSVCADKTSLAALVAMPLEELPKTVILNNDLHGDLSVGGAPQGHPPLQNMLTIPLLRGPDLIGQLALANCEGGYHTDASTFLAPIAAILSEWMDSREARLGRVRVQEALKRLQHQSSEVLSATHDGVIIVNHRGKIYDINESGEATFKIKSAQIGNMTVPELITLPDLDDKSAEGVEAYLNAIEGGVMKHYANITALLQGGGSLPIDLVIAAQESGPHKLYKFYIRNLLSGHEKAQEALLQAQEEKNWIELQTQSVKQEIIESKKLEQRALAQLEKVERASRTKLELLATMSHELTTPMNSIVGFSNTLLDGALGKGITQEQRDYIQYISDSGRKLLDYIDGVLDLSGVEEGRMEVDPDDALTIGDYAKFSAHIRNDQEVVEALFQRALELDPGNPIILSNYSLFRTNIRKEHERSEELYKYAYEADPDSALTLGDYAVFLSDVRKHNERAEEMYKQAIKLDPNNALNLANYARFLSKVHGYHDRADSYYRKAIENDPENTAILARYAHFIMDVRKDQKQAEAWFERALETAPNALSLRLDFAFFLFDIDNENRAMEILDEIEPRLYGEELLMEQFYKFAFGRSTAARAQALSRIRDLLKERVRCPLFEPFSLVRRLADEGHSDARLMEALARVITVRDTLQVLSGQPKWRAIQMTSDGSSLQE
ncbi:histidine kinase dimerization/phospho-acceptor domain-containing protein [Magnetovibrio blakemorei]|uniref:histidine kinase n=2 Tax=Pseudomonadota TaxID=1224 RepID=C4RAF8_9PROT|nr:histidine kinase dimerization/phospho-acceptor domain-containing protein [Magnetovibrio blakemorei]OEJ67306.1 hypothetical protein BEN30_00290 [Magnetovibrio blakemorei]CAV30803.1 histidine kinase, TPR motif [Magnetovibrio blakemorei]